MAARREKRAREVQREQIRLPDFAWRRRGVLSLFVLAGAALVWRAFDQQVFETDRLKQAGSKRYLTQVEMQAHRGLITDRRGEVLAASTPVYTVVADPRLLSQDDPGLPELAKALELTPAALRKKLLKAKHLHSVRLRKRLPPAQAEYAEQVAAAMGLKGVTKESNYRRFYPTGEVFSHVVGFTNYQDEGQEGLERAFNAELAGTNGAKLALRDGLRRVVADVVTDVESVRPREDGQNIALSLDGRLQYLAYRELKAAVRRNRALGGAAVLLDVRSGEVLAMVNQPGFNPNGDRSSKNGRLRNRSVTDLFQPGSTMKPIAVAAALDRKTIDLDAVIDTDPGYMKVRGGTVRDHDNLHEINLETLLGKSSNVGAAKVALTLKPQQFWRTLHDFGFGLPTETGFPAEVQGRLIPWQEWAEIDQATMSFGYAISVSALQLARAYAVLANDGVRLPVTLLKRTQVPEGERVISAATARAVRNLLESVTQPGGTAPQAAIAGYRVAGKTGTSKKGLPDEKPSRYIAVFAGMAPLSDPRLAMVVMVDEPRGQVYYGGQVAGPVFSKVMGEALRLLNITPDDLSAPQTRLANVTKPSAGAAQ